MLNYGIFIFIVIGYLCKYFNIVRKNDSEILIKLVFYLFLPSTILYSFIGISFTANFLYLPIAGFVISLICYGIGYLISNILNLEPKTKGTFIIASGSMNQGLFIYPFFILYLGKEGLARIVMFDIGQLPLLYGLAYYIGCRYGDYKLSLKEAGLKLLFWPVIWAILAGFIINYYPISLPNIFQPLWSVIEFLHNCTTPVIFLSLGIFVAPKLQKTKAVISILLTRFGIAIMLAFLFVLFLNIRGLEMLTIILGAPVPPAMLTLVYAVEQKLNPEFASVAISIAIVFGLFYSTALFAIFTS
ncbi:MAG: AEC family transporter [Candidatus Thermoplasmatota archaeon]